jgi:tRNA-2-methylthio-N6-dimethylallyladenosine synthase
MEDNVDIHEKEQRLYRLNELVTEKANKQNQKYMGQILDVLVEGTSKKDDSMLTGYSNHNKLINFKGNKADIGKIVKVKVTEVKTWALKGEQVESINE